MSNSLNNHLQTRKRKQPNNDSSSFLTPSIPAKRSAPFAMVFPQLIPSNGFNDNSKFIQTNSIFTLTSSQQFGIRQEELKFEINQLRSEKTSFQKEYESTIETIKRCLSMTRSLLIEKSQLEKKQIRKRSMENRLRLGQFVTQRQGLTFVEQWIDGYEFSDKQRMKEQLTQTKEKLDRERKILTKKKTSFQQQQQFMIGTINNEINNSNLYSQDINNPVYNSSMKSKRIAKNSTIKTFTK